MKCVICKKGKTYPGTSTVTLEKDKATLIVKLVPALVCQNCGEAYMDEKTTSRLLKTAEEAAHEGVRVDLRDYAA